MTAPVAALLAALFLIAVHVVTPALRFLAGRPRSAWLSAAGGVSVAYVFVHLLPELAAGQEHLARALGGAAGEGTPGGIAGFAERHVYLVALAGLLLYYGLEKLASRERGPDGTGGAPAAHVFALHMASFALYDLVIGYLLVRTAEAGARALGAFAVAMALHFVVSDFGLFAHHRDAYRRVGRWVLVAAQAAGVSLGLATTVSPAAVAVLVAFLAGGIVLNVMKEEVPGERESRYGAFALGAAGYAALLLAI